MTSAVVSALTPSLLPASGSEENIVLPHTPDLVWGLVSFVIIALVLIKYALPRFTAVLDERTRKIEQGLSLADKAKSDEANASAQAARTLEEARRQAAQVAEQAQQEARTIIAQARVQAQDESERVLEAARRQIKADQQAARVSLRTDVGKLATDLAERVIGEHLRDQSAQERVIDRFLTDLDAADAADASQETR